MDTLAQRRYRDETQRLIGQRGPLAVLVFVVGVGVATLLEYLYHPERVVALAIVCTVESIICVSALALYRSRRTRHSVVRVTLGVCTALLLCVTSYASYAGASPPALAFLFIVYVLTTALLFPWNARSQGALAASALLFYGLFIATSAANELPVAYELFAVCAAAALSVLGVAVLDRQRGTVFAQREELDQQVAAFRDLTATFHGFEPQRVLLGTCRATLRAFHLQRLWVVWRLGGSGTRQGYTVRDDGENFTVTPLDDPDLLWAETACWNGSMEARIAARAEPRLPVSLREQGVHTVLCIPLSFEGERLGAICADRNGKPFELHKRELALASVLASGTAIALTNARLYQQVAAASEEKSVFLARTAHELRNPLQAMLWDLDQERTSSSERLRQHANATLRIAEELQDFAEVATRQITVHPEPVNLAETFEQLKTIARSQLDDAPVTLRARVGAGAEAVVTDPLRLRQVLGNLLSNAVKCTARGAIDLDASRRGSEIVLAVRDTGPGIEAEELAAIFKPFCRGRSYGRARGLGLGLAIAGEIAEVLGGRIEVESTLGEGSTFRLHLPAGQSSACEDSRPLPAVGPPPPAPATAPRVPRAAELRTPEAVTDLPTVLLVEDDDACRARAAAALARDRFRVVQARDGFEGARQAQLCRPDVVVLDLGIPGMNGRELLATLRRTRPDLTVIVTTGELGSEHEVACDAWLGKPYSADALLSAIRRSAIGSETVAAAV